MCLILPEGLHCSLKNLRELLLDHRVQWYKEPWLCHERQIKQCFNMLRVGTWVLTIYSKMWDQFGCWQAPNLWSIILKLKYWHSHPTYVLTMSFVLYKSDHLVLTLLKVLSRNRHNKLHWLQASDFRCWHRKQFPSMMIMKMCCARIVET